MPTKGMVRILCRHFKISYFSNTQWWNILCKYCWFKYDSNLEEYIMAYLKAGIFCEWFVFLYAFSLSSKFLTVGVIII